MSATHSLAEWASVLSLGVSAISVIKFALAFADADLAYFDPRPLAVRALESGRLDPLLIARVNARHALADRLASSTSRLTAPKGATR